MADFITAFFESVGDLFDPTTTETSVAAAIVGVIAVPVAAVVCRKAVGIFRRFTNG